MEARASDFSLGGANKALPSEHLAWSSLPFHDAVFALLEHHQVTLAQLARASGVPREQLQSMVDGDTTTPLGVIESVAAAFRAKPRAFLDYRLGAVLAALSRDPKRANQLFLASLSEIERAGIDPGRFDNRTLRAVVNTLLAEEEMTLAGLAESMGQKQSVVSAVLNGKRPLDSNIPASIADLLGLQPEYLLAYRLATLGQWLRSHPHELDSLPGKGLRRMAMWSGGKHAESLTVPPNTPGGPAPPRARSGSGDPIQ